MGTIGSVQVAWSFLENEMRRKMRAAGLQQKIAKGPIISHWRTYMQELEARSDNSVIAEYLDPIEKIAATRNLLVHGIQSLSVDPYGVGGATVVCAGPDCFIHTLSIEIIRDLLSEIATTTRSIRMLRTMVERLD